MKKRRNRTKTLTATLSVAGWNAIAPQAHPLHDRLIADGLEITTKSRLWRRKDGSWTARFSYANPNDPGLSTTIIVRGLEVV